jgi:hypothetical protein
MQAQVHEDARQDLRNTWWSESQTCTNQGQDRGVPVLAVCGGGEEHERGSPHGRGELGAHPSTSRNLCALNFPMHPAKPLGGACAGPVLVGRAFNSSLAASGGRSMC